MARQHHVVAPHAVARQGALHRCGPLTSDGVVDYGVRLVAPPTPARQTLSRQAGWRDRPIKGRDPAPFFLLSFLSLLAENS